VELRRYGDEYHIYTYELEHLEPYVVLTLEIPDNLEILVYVQRPFGSQPVIQSGNYGDYYVDNCVSLPVGKAAIPDLK
jgi:hypothetical protein